MKWHSIDKDGDPVQFSEKRGRWAGSDEAYLVVLENKWITTAFFFADSYGHWWSSQFEPYDKYYTGMVTHWAKMPKLPKVEIEDDNN